MSVQPIVKIVQVGLSPADAFDLFTTRIGEWWPVESHSVSAGLGAPSKSLTMTTGFGGELVEIAADGSRHVWGVIEEWEPGQSLALTWHPGRNDDLETRVRVEFRARGEGTEVTLTHSNWEVLGDEGQGTRDSYDGGWNGVLDRFANST